MGKFKIGDRVKFISDKPSLFASRYGLGDYKMENDEYIGIIRNVIPLIEDIYLYTIVTMTPIRWNCLVQEADIIGKLADSLINKLSEYDEVSIYKGARIEYYLAQKNGKYGIIDSDGNELTPIIMDEIHEMIDTDGCIPLVKDGKWGLVHLYNYVEPIYDRMEIRSEEYVKVWLGDKQGWLDSHGQFTCDESQACIGSWCDFEK
jgi:hypothetical protein